MKFEWKDIAGDTGTIYAFAGGKTIGLHVNERMDDEDEDNVISAGHNIPIPTARALHEALGRALEEVDPRPVTDSISATLAACGESHLVNVVHGPDGTRVYRTPGTLRSISTEELAKLGLKPKAHLPSDGYLLECGHWSIHKQWCTKCAADIVAISQRASQPEPPPTGNGDLVTPSLLEALADYPELAALVSARDAFGRAEYGIGLRTHNGRDPLEDARQELGDLLQYLQQATMEGKDIGPLLKLCRDGLKVFKQGCDTCFGCGWQVNNHAPRLRCECGVEPWVESDPEPPTLHPRPFFWDSNERFGFVNVAQEDIPADECMTVAELLQHIPNALDAHESHHPLNPTEFPNFGFRIEHDGPRTLREYLEAP